MFSLRKVDKVTGQISNIELGSSYVLTRRESSPEAFEEIKQQTFMWLEEKAEASLYAFVQNSNGEAIGIFSHSHNFIVGERGSTYEKLK